MSHALMRLRGFQTPKKRTSTADTFKRHFVTPVGSEIPRAQIGVTPTPLYAQGMFESAGFTLQLLDKPTDRI